MERKLCIMPGCLWDAQLREPCYFSLQRSRTTDLCDCFSCFLHGEVCWVDDARAIPAQVWEDVSFPSLRRVFHHDSKTIHWQVMAQVVWHTSTRAVPRRSLNRQPWLCGLIRFWTHLPAYLIETQFANVFSTLHPSCHARFFSRYIFPVIVYPEPVLSKRTRREL